MDLSPTRHEFWQDRPRCGVQLPAAGQEGARPDTDRSPQVQGCLGGRPEEPT